MAQAEIVARTAGVIAGRACVDETFRQVDTAHRMSPGWSPRGRRSTPARCSATVAGPLASILTAERTALNFLGHLSGIATITRAFVDAAGPRLAGVGHPQDDPGLRALEKAAVRAGGGVNHRATSATG